MSPSPHCPPQVALCPFSCASSPSSCFTPFLMLCHAISSFPCSLSIISHHFGVLGSTRASHCSFSVLSFASSSSRSVWSPHPLSPCPSSVTGTFLDPAVHPGLLPFPMALLVLYRWQHPEQCFVAIHRLSFSKFSQQVGQFQRN